MGQTVSASGWSWLREVTRYQWMVFLIAWLGWSLDNTDFNLFALVLRPAVTELLGGTASPADIGRVGGILSMTGLLGWALGGFLFGIIGDYAGRVRTLTWSVVLVGLFTALQGLTHNTFTFGICRFLTGVGTGAELVVGIPLVAEAFANVHRAKVLGIMMTGGAFGSLIGGQLFAYVGPYGWRYVMFAGVAPALILLVLRRGLGEPDQFQAVQDRRQALRSATRLSSDDQAFMRFAPAQLFAPAIRFSTFIGVLFCVGTLLSIWTSQIWLPTIQGQLLAKAGISGAAAAPFIGHGMTLWGLGGIIGYATFGFIADAIGRRMTIIFYNTGAILVGLYMYLWTDTYDLWPYLLPAFGYFVFGVFSGHAIYLPELFPTHVRATGVSFCNGSGRVITSFGPLVAGLMAGYLNGAFNQATAIMTCFAGLSILAALLGRETKDAPLPD